nr:HEAT repeat domain-containing protein [Desulfobulbaceae bacterium]
MSGSNEKKRSAVLRGIASVLNTCGNAVVVSFDAGAKLTGSFGNTFKKLSGMPFRKKSSATSEAYQRECDTLLKSIKDYEQKIKSVYYEIGKASARLTETDGDEAQISNSGTVKELLEKIHGYENSVKKMRGRIAGLEEERAAEEARKKEDDGYRRATLMAGRARKGKQRGDASQLTADINNAIKEALIHGTFETASDRAVFDNVATDLLDKEAEIQMLAAAELGKMKNIAAVPVLHAAIGMAEGHLATEIVNALISLGDPSSVDVLRQSARDTSARVRITSLRGLYKLAPEDKDVRQQIIDSLSDINPEVRKTGATLLGWLDESKAVPALIQCLTDEDERVRKAVVSALANIRDTASMLPIIRQLRDDSTEVRKKALDAIKVISGQEVAFDLSAKGDELLEIIDSMKKWWQEVRASGQSKPFIIGATDDQKPTGSKVSKAEKPASESEPEPKIASNPEPAEPAATVETNEPEVADVKKTTDKDKDADSAADKKAANDTTSAKDETAEQDKPSKDSNKDKTETNSKAKGK